MHLVISISYRVVLRVLSSLSSVSIVIAKAGHTASQSLQPMHLSSPLGYLLNACSPLNLGESGVFSSGYCMVILRLNKLLNVTLSPASNSNNNKDLKNPIILRIIILNPKLKSDSSSRKQQRQAKIRSQV